MPLVLPCLCALQDAAAYAHAECALFALGEVALLREARAPDGLVVAVQALTAAAPSAEQVRTLNLPSRALYYEAHAQLIMLLCQALTSCHLH